MCWTAGGGRPRVRRLLHSAADKPVPPAGNDPPGLGRVQAEEGVDSLRAVEKVGQHPGKMWVVRGKRMTPLMPLSPAEQPWHSTQMAALPEVYVQNASLEIAWTRVAKEGTIAGHAVMPFLTQGTEGLDVNTEYDFWYCEQLVARGEAQLPQVPQAPFFG